MAVALFRNLVALLVLLAAGFASGKDESCSDGSTCLCDISHSGHSHGTVVFCEDFENSAYDDGTGAGWRAVYGPGDAFDCDGDTNDDLMEEGTGNPDCINIVEEGACDVSGETDCVFQGTQTMGFKHDETYTHGIAGVSSAWSAAPTFGITQALKFSTNWTRGPGPGYKNNEWQDSSPGKHSLHGGQDADEFWNAVESCTAGGFSEATNDRLWDAKIFCEGTNSGCAAINDPWDCCTGSGTGTCRGPCSASSCTASIGRGFRTAENVIEFDASSTNYDFSTWSLGEWACLRTKWTNFDTTSSRVEQWFMVYGDGAETKVIDISGFNTVGATGNDSGLTQIMWNVYFNGAQNGGACGYGSTSAGPCVYAGLSRAYRYEDNLIVTSGDPVPCSELGFDGSAPAAPTLRGIRGGGFRVGDAALDLLRVPRSYAGTTPRELREWLEERP